MINNDGLEKMKYYKLTPTAKDPIITLKVPSEILRGLVKRSEENGSSIEMEIITRLARSLERDQEMIDADNALAQLAFERVTKIKK